jgi:hypothetical protein
MGIESPPERRQSDLTNKWRCSQRFFAASSLFSFLRISVYQGASLAGDETDGTEKTRVPKMRQPENLERRDNKNAQRKSSTVFLCGLRLLFKVVALTVVMLLIERSESSDPLRKLKELLRLVVEE